MNKQTIVISDDGFIKITDGENETPLGKLQNGFLLAYKKGNEPVQVNALHFLQDLRSALHKHLTESE